ncbi:MAG: SDR family oxidoreductase [Steroidobacteraceae bacterium]
MALLRDRVVIVTGGAAGMGSGIVRRFVREGALVTFTDVQESLGQEVATETGARFVKADVSNADDWRVLIGEVERRHGRLDALINNAGIVPVDSIEAFDLATWRRTFAVNVDGPLFGCKFAIEAMKRNPGGSKGSIVNIVSTSALFGAATQLSYGSSKGAARLLTKSVALYCARERLNIRCNAIHPGPTHTSLIEKMLDAAPDRAQMQAYLDGMTPVGRMGTPADIAGMALFLISDDSAYLTGGDFFVDGGLTANHPGL